MQKILASSEPIFVLKPNGDENSSKSVDGFLNPPVHVNLKPNKVSKGTNKVSLGT